MADWKALEASALSRQIQRTYFERWIDDLELKFIEFGDSALDVAMIHFMASGGLVKLQYQTRVVWDEIYGWCLESYNQSEPSSK